MPQFQVVFSGVVSNNLPWSLASLFLSPLLPRKASLHAPPLGSLGSCPILAKVQTLLVDSALALKESRNLGHTLKTEVQPLGNLSTDREGNKHWMIGNHSIPKIFSIRLN